MMLGYIFPSRNRAQELFWWPGVSSDISEYVLKCENCIKNSKVKHQPAMESELPSGPWVEVASDMFEFRSEIYLLLVDYYSKWIEVRKVFNQTASVVIDEIKSVFSCYGVPKVLRSDNGPCYSSDLFKEFAKEWGFIHRTSSPRYPESNGMAERAVGTIKTLWSKSSDKDSALLAYRATPLISGFSPGELMFSRSMRTSLGESKKKVSFQEYEDTSNEKTRVAKEKWNKKHKACYLSVLKENDRVWVKSPQDLGAEGVIVKEDTNPYSYWVRIGNSVVRRNRKHLFLLDGKSRQNEQMSIRPLGLDDMESETTVSNGNMSEPNANPNEAVCGSENNEANAAASLPANVATHNDPIASLSSHNSNDGIPVSNVSNSEFEDQDSDVDSLDSVTPVDDSNNIQDDVFELGIEESASNQNVVDNSPVRTKSGRVIKKPARFN